MVGGTIILILAVLAALAPWIAPYRFDEMSLLKRLKPPSTAHWFGTDEFGRDVLSRTLMGARLSLLMGIGATLISLVIGVPLGLLAGYRRGWFDEVLMRAMDVLLSFPPIMLGLLILAVTQPALWKAIIAIGIVYVPPHRAHHAQRHPRSRKRGIHSGRARARRQHPLHPVLGNPAQCLAADRGRGELAHHVRHPARRGAELRRHGRPAAKLRLGPDGRARRARSSTARPGSHWRPAWPCA